MRKLLFLLILGALLAGADIAAKSAAEERLEDRAQEAAGAGANVTADIRSFPFLGRLLLSGSVPEVRVRARDVEAPPLTLAQVRVDLDGVTLERNALYGGNVHLKDISSGEISVLLDAGLLTRLLGVPITIDGDEVTVTVAGQPVTADAEVQGGSLVLRVAGLPVLSLPKVTTPLVACTATRVEVEGEQVRLTCALDTVPPVLRD